MKTMNRIAGWWLALALLAPGVAHATLLSRLGGQAYYDNVLNITWLANANLAATNTFGVSGINSDGSMTWGKANAWIAAMNSANYLGYGDWRLPTMVDTGTSGCNFSFSGTDCGYNVQTGTAATTVYSEMASLFYDTLGNVAYFDTSGSSPQAGWSSTPTAGPFTNLQSSLYWSGLEYLPGSHEAWRFDFSYGNQTASDLGDPFFAWAVRSGDVAASAPEPGTLALLGLGLAGIGWMRRKAKC